MDPVETAEPAPTPTPPPAPRVVRPELPASMPHDADLERAVLGAALLDQEAARDVVAGLRVEDFWEPTHRAILHAVADLVGRGEAADLVATTSYLREAGQLEAAGGAVYLTGLLDTLPDITGVSTHASMLRELSGRRRALEVITRGSTALQLGQGLDHVAKVAAELAVIAETGRPRVSVLEERLAPVGLAAMTEEPPARAWVFRQAGGVGLLPRGRVGILASAGGVGKTHMLLAAAVAVATGRQWLGAFDVDQKAAGSRVLLLLGEEDRDELARRLWKLAERLRLSPAERQDVASRVVVACLAGVSIQLTTMKDGMLCESAELGDLRRLLSDGGEPWALVGIDPLSRFASGDFEISSESATRVVQAAETLCDVPGNPAVLLSAHSSKYARRADSADVRGAGALTDAARWVATLKVAQGAVVLEVIKSNYSLPLSPVRLEWSEGVLRALSAEDLELEERRAQHRQAEELDADVAAVVEAVRREGGKVASKDAIAQAAGMRAQRGRAAIDLAIARNMLVRVGTARASAYALPDDGVRVPVPSVCVLHPPDPPDGGTAVLGGDAARLGRTSGRPGTATGRPGRPSNTETDPGSDVSFDDLGEGQIPDEELKDGEPW